MSYGEAQRSVGDIIHALEREEDWRVKLLEESVQRETKRIEVEKHRLEVEKEAR